MEPPGSQVKSHSKRFEERLPGYRDEVKRKVAPLGPSGPGNLMEEGAKHDERLCKMYLQYTFIHIYIYTRIIDISI